jgi:hypothetical protein
MRDIIKKILKEEVNKKYQKPTEKVERLIYNWLNDYFEGSQMYQIKSYEFSYTFEWCKNGKEIMSVVIDFNNDYDAWDDKRTTNERDFDNGELQIPKEIVNELMSDIPVRRAYLRYVIEEWFDDTYLGEIQNIMKRTDISIDNFTEYPERVETCVPPMTKSDDVNLDDMIDYIVSNTLWRRKDLEKRHLDEPGYIEKLYLEKLRSEEMKRVRGQ